MLLARIRQMIDECGWAVQGVVPTHEDPPDSRPFLYTAGLAGKGLPELYMDLPPFLEIRSAHAAINMIGHHGVTHGRLPEGVFAAAEVPCLVSASTDPTVLDRMTAARRFAPLGFQVASVVPQGEGSRPWA